jgi:hypothetical protein
MLRIVSCHCLFQWLLHRHPHENLAADDPILILGHLQDPKGVVSQAFHQPLRLARRSQDRCALSHKSNRCSRDHVEPESLQM